MEKTIPIFKMTIDPTDERSGVQIISLVDKPAIEQTWQAFNAHHEPRPMKFEIQSEEMRIITGPIMVADRPIYRRDEDGKEWYCVFEAKAIRELVYDFFKNGRNTTANIQHSKEMDGVFMFESWLEDDGSWSGSFRVDNDGVWSMVKDGTFTGFSIEGTFKRQPMDEDAEIMEEIKRQLAK